MASEQIRVEDMMGQEVPVLLYCSSGANGFRQMKALVTLPSGPIRFLVTIRDTANRDREETFGDMAKAVAAYNAA
jgi:hypothetical protein